MIDSNSPGVTDSDLQSEDHLPAEIDSNSPGAIDSGLPRVMDLRCQGAVAPNSPAADHLPGATGSPDAAGLHSRDAARPLVVAGLPGPPVTRAHPHYLPSEQAGAAYFPDACYLRAGDPLCPVSDSFRPCVPLF